jgi:hypothetical protein
MNMWQIDARKALWLALGVGAAMVALIFFSNANLARFAVDGYRDYPTEYIWRLVEPTAFTHFVMWASYLAHQCVSWGSIWYAKRQSLKYTTTLHPINLAMLAINGAFVLWHWVETQWIYDGLAQDLPSSTSQGSVIIMLVLILAMETPRRGLFFEQKVPFRQEFIRLLRKYHGYVFSWAIVYTFWFHPMVSTQGHLIGFFYMFMLLIQSSLFFTTLHVNKFWTFILEFTVLPHGVLVALQQGNNLWPMFLFGFAGLVLLTQLHGIGLSTRAKWFIIGAFIAANLLVYGVMFSVTWQIFLRDLTAIPIIEYGSVFVLYALFMLSLGGVRLWQRVTAKNATGEA